MCLRVYYVFGRMRRSLVQRITEPVRLLSMIFCSDIELFGRDIVLVCRDIGLLI